MESIEFNLSFKKPEMVSVYEDKDYLKIVFLNTHQFMMDEDGLSINILPSGYEIIVELPRQ